MSAMISVVVRVAPSLVSQLRVCTRPETNTVVVGEEADLFKTQLEAQDLNWVSVSKPEASIRATARIRYHAIEASARIVPACSENVTVVFDEPQKAISPGQSVVFYDGPEVLGGGIIR